MANNNNNIFNAVCNILQTAAVVGAAAAVADAAQNVDNKVRGIHKGQVYKKIGSAFPEFYVVTKICNSGAWEMRRLYSRTAVMTSSFDNEYHKDFGIRNQFIFDHEMTPAEFARVVYFM